MASGSPASIKMVIMIANAIYTNGTSGKNFTQFANLALGKMPQSIMSSSIPATATVRIKHRLSVGSAQAAGTYTTLITYIITGTPE
jgi:hypothetical protein